MKRVIQLMSFILILFFISINVVWAGSNDIKIKTGFLQSQFRDLSREIGLAINFLPMSPAEPLGILGFDIGLAVSAIDIDEEASFWKDVVSDKDPPGYLLLPKLQVEKGLPFGIDIGLLYSNLPDSNISLIGGEIKWAILKGSIVSPALSVRGSYSALSGVDDIDIKTYRGDISMSKGFLFLTPYVGIGEILIKSSESSNQVSLEDESISAFTGFAGVKFSFLIFNIVGEADIAETVSYNLRINVGF